MIIRCYTPKDRAAVEHIHFETGFLGKSLVDITTRGDLWDKEIAWYLDEEPKSCFVAVEKGKVVGYIAGCLDDSRSPGFREFIGGMLMNYLRSPLLPKKDRIYWRGFTSAVFKEFILGKSAFKTPPQSGHLHINLLPEARGKGAGSKLLNAFFAYAKKKGVKMIHADSFQTRLNPNKNFWFKNGFTEYTKAPTAFWKAYYPKEKIMLCCYVKKLS